MQTKWMIAALMVVLLGIGAVCGQAPLLECPAHSTFSTCMTRCPVTCSNYQNPPASCVQGCVIGCECEEGFVKISKGQYAGCVKKYECPLYTTKRARPYPAVVSRKHQLIREMIAARRVSLEPSSTTTSTTTTTTSSSTTTTTQSTM